MEQLREDEGVVIAAGTVRGTQSLVHTMARCWRHREWTALEVAWRWAFGVPAVAVAGYEALKIARSVPLDMEALRRISIVEPMDTAATLAKAMDLLLPPVLHVLAWLGPLLVAVWVVASSVGRTVVLRRVDATLHRRLGTLMVLQALRVVTLLGSFCVWFLLLQWISGKTVTGPLAAGGEPNLVGYFALAIITTLGLFSAWAIASWAVSVAPLLAMLRGTGAWASLKAAFWVGPLRSKLIEINLVMGIVKIALIVLAIVFTATPLPFEAVATPTFMAWWWAGVTLLYFIASDFFHVTRQVAYLELWRAYEGSSLK
ncbi:hypothetical protein GCM10011507_30760 [Edaphobacter acidisoli]|uniref:Uncharacterized protein n=1 Tax=Edaphobacter acidisoli TaxID=2040573 RepID=A0A916W928_9BACT|nr:hypothetical protein [Edaphobacter acidisoli]GGA77323.1 hypothetical protein GCM10011507_30760 [Edaphobacter acidisoli]